MPRSKKYRMTTKYANLHKGESQMFAGSTMMSFHSSNIIIFSSSSAYYFLDCWIKLLNQPSGLTYKSSVFSWWSRQ